MNEVDALSKITAGDLLDGTLICEEDTILGVMVSRLDLMEFEPDYENMRPSVYGRRMGVINGQALEELVFDDAGRMAIHIREGDGWRVLKHVECTHLPLSECRDIISTPTDNATLRIFKAICMMYSIPESVGRSIKYSDYNELVRVSEFMDFLASLAAGSTSSQ